MDEKVTGSESSPEQLKSYIKVANAGIWIAIIAIVVLLAGVCVWGIFGTLETTVSAVAVCEDGKISVWADGGDSDSITAGMTLKIDGESYEIVSVSSELVSVSESGLSDYALYLGDLGTSEKVCSMVAYGGVDSGIYAAQIVVESISPISFLFS